MRSEFTFEFFYLVEVWRVVREREERESLLCVVGASSGVLLLL